VLDARLRMSGDVITVCPSNWLYNAGVIGLCRILEDLGEQVEQLVSDDGSATLSITRPDSEIFERWDSLSPKSKKGRSLVYGWKDAYYANQSQLSIEARIRLLTKGVEGSEKEKESGSLFSCSFCARKVRAKRTDSTFLNQAFGNILLGSEKSFSNMYWNNSARDFVCPSCQFILMCHHLALTRLSDGSEIFINAPSFSVMYHLNRFAKDTFADTSPEETRQKRDILAMSVIEYATKTKATLGVWTAMNLEIVTKKVAYSPGKSKPQTQVEFFSLPYNIVDLLSNREVAAALSALGEFGILNIVLRQDYSQLVELGYRLLRRALSPTIKPNDWTFIEYWLCKAKNKRDEAGNKSVARVRKAAEKILELYALIEGKSKRSEPYGTTSHSTTRY
jgi:CRISPR-associated protein Cst1